MKKFFLLTIGLTLALGASAASTFTVDRVIDSKARIKSHSIGLTQSATDIITEQPEGTLISCERSGECIYNNETYLYTGEQSATIDIVLAPDGQTVYLKDIMGGITLGTWVRGEIDGNTISVPLGQPVYWSDTYQASIVLSWGSTSFSEVDGSLEFTADDEVDTAIFSLHGNVITLENSEGNIYAEGNERYISTGLATIWDDINSWTGYLDWNTVVTIPTRPGTPANPSIIEWIDNGQTDGSTQLLFAIDPMDIDGYPMDLSQLTYSVFIDDETIYPMQDGKTELPCNPDEENIVAASFNATNSGANHMFNWRIGVQLYYTVNGIRNASDIVYIEVFDDPGTGITETAAAQQVTSVKYYDVNGRQLEQPCGITIQVTTHADGSTSAAKVVK